MNNKKTRLRFIKPDLDHPVEVPMAGSSVQAGFPSPAEDFMEPPLDLNKLLVRNPSATFYARVSGDSMRGNCIEDGDLLVVDKSVEPYDGCIAVCWLDGEFTIKEVELKEDHILLVPANDKYKPIPVTADNNFVIWGVVRYVVKKV